MKLSAYAKAIVAFIAGAATPLAAAAAEQLRVGDAKP
jgi:hypothetical protein